MTAAFLFSRWIIKLTSPFQGFIILFCFRLRVSSAAADFTPGYGYFVPSGLFI
jgi:hypothetical protein